MTIQQYLLDHEDDIAMCVNDFGDLLQVFIAMIGREPEEDSFFIEDEFSDMRREFS